MSTETFFTIELPFCERMKIRRTRFSGGDGPRVAVIAGVHGDELEGLYVCHRLAAWLEELLATAPHALIGSVELYPALNTLGLDTLTRGLPVFDTDLNRAFPGAAGGPLPKRLADAVMTALTGASLVVDIHASNIYLREIPQVRINQEFELRLVPLARRMNLDLIWLHGAATVLEIILPLMLWQGIAFRPERNPEITQTLNDISWIIFLVTTTTVLLQNLVIGMLVLQDKSANPIFPRWYAYFNFFAVAGVMPAGFVVFFRTGPLTWKGIIVWAIGVSVFFVWICATAWLIHVAAGRQRDEHTAAQAVPVAA